MKYFLILILITILALVLLDVGRWWIALSFVIESIVIAFWAALAIGQKSDENMNNFYKEKK